MTTQQMTKQTLIRCIGLVCSAILLPAVPLLSALPAKPQSTQPPMKRPAQSDKKATPDDGQKKFKQNCSRCHEAPQNLSPSISGTVLRHMRVRASLSAEDERAILAFLNP